MSIAALHLDTSRAITSSVALNDAISVVKELVDNALDARADTISIELSANTLDIIQVKDNGTGIGVEDRQLLCRPGCTSKIRTIEDLASLGGSYLGFRGEALASVAELSASVTITTRVDGEVVGSALKFGATGKLVSSSSASHPVGTTVRIQEFFSKIPVRRQSALKSTSKTIKDLRKLLYAYAFARPKTRFTLKILKSKDGKANWSYAPSSATASLSEIASKLVGHEVSSQCKEYVHTWADPQDRNGDIWTLRALLLDPGSDLQKVSGTDLYFSVDKRPVNSERGIMKDCSKMYKEYVQSIYEKTEGKSCPSKPFLYAQVTCPSNSYDVNVEPAKDELLFFNPSALKELFEELFTKAYGKLKISPDPASSSSGTKQIKSGTLNSFNLLLARKPVLKPTVHNREDTSERIEPPLDSSGMQFNMYAGDDEDFPAPHSDSDISLELSAAEEDMTASNPWTHAKMNIRLSPKKVSTSSPPNGTSKEPTAPAVVEQLSSPQMRGGFEIDIHRTPLGRNQQLPSPVTSPRIPEAFCQNPGPPSQVMRRRGHWTDENEDDSAPSSAPNLSIQGPSLLDIWVKQSQEASEQTLAERHVRANPTQHPGNKSIKPAPGRQGHFSFPPAKTNRAENTSLCFPQPRSATSIMTPFKTPFKRGTQHSCHRSDSDAAGDELIKQGPPVSNPERSRQTDHVSQVIPASTPGMSNQRDLADILEFEKQKRLAVARQKKQALQSMGSLPPDLLSSSQIGNISPTAVGKGTQKVFTDVGQREEREAFNERFSRSISASSPISQADPRNCSPHHNHHDTTIHDPGQVCLRSETTYSKISERIIPDNCILATIPDSDPRGYLIQHNRMLERKARADSSGIKETGLKIKRTRTMRLPLESIPANEVTCGLVTTTTTPNATADAWSGQLLTIDEYITTGEVRVIDWDPGAEEVSTWQSTLNELITTKSPQAHGPVNGDEASLLKKPAIDLDLEEMIKNHITKHGK